MTASSSAVTTQPEPKAVTNFNLPAGWVNNEMLMMRRVEYLQAAIVDLSRNAMQIITWSEMIQEGIDEMQKSLSISETEPETEEEDQQENENDGTETGTIKTYHDDGDRKTLPSNPIL